MTGRLIDADALKEALNKSIVEAIQHGNNFSDAFKNDSQEWSAEIWTIEDKIDNAPTVDAIPISWINDWYDRYNYAEVGDLLNDWASERKKNE